MPQFFSKKTCLLPTPAGWTMLIGTVMVLTIGGTVSIVPFLAPDSPINGEALIVEGWLPDYCLERVASISTTSRYTKVFVTGGPLESGSYLKEYRNYAELGAATLHSLSVPDSLITPVAANYSPVDRTYGSAVALKSWIDSTHCSIRTFDLYSQSTHTRRSALLFRRALGTSFKIGAVAVADPDYHPGFWWKSSKGVRSVLDESIAYFYALFFILISTVERE